jgi:hypothetical protein
MHALLSRMMAMMMSPAHTPLLAPLSLDDLLAQHSTARHLQLPLLVLLLSAPPPVARALLQVLATATLRHCTVALDCSV